MAFEQDSPNFLHASEQTEPSHNYYPFGILHIGLVFEQAEPSFSFNPAILEIERAGSPEFFVMRVSRLSRVFLVFNQILCLIRTGIRI